MTNTFAKLFTPPVFWYTDVAFIIFTMYSTVLHICDVFARSKFVQIHFFVQCKLLVHSESVGSSQEHG